MWCKVYFNWKYIEMIFFYFFIFDIDTLKSSKNTKKKTLIWYFLVKKHFENDKKIEIKKIKTSFEKKNWEDKIKF